MIQQLSFQLTAKNRGFHLITEEVLSHLPELPQTGLLQLFIRHTSAGLSINENADPDVLHDFELFFNRIAPEHLPGLRHTLEGPDDMPAHVKAALIGHSVSIPISDHELSMGRWQGIFLGEFRTEPRRRELQATIIGE
jgi:secondary thiamine-phosphate synthase enzyme